MATSYELNMKPSFSEQLLGFPESNQSQLWEKINYLLDDPKPDGYLKLKVRAYDKVFRLKVGDWRLFYSFGDGWVKLLTLRRRDEDTYDQNQSVDYEKPRATGAEGEPGEDVDIEELGDEPSAQERRRRDWQQRWDNTAEVEEPETLPREITGDWLRQLKVPQRYFSELIPCTNEDQLLEADVPQEVMDRVLENLYPSDIDEVMEEPDLVVKETEDLVRYKEGDLFAFLLKLDARQEKLIDWALDGPTMVKGGPGTGKSTVALYRVKSLLEQPGNTGDERVLFTTYTRALVAASKQLLEQLLDEEQFERVDVLRCDQVAWRIADDGGERPNILPHGQPKQRLRKAMQSFEPPGESSLQRKMRRQALEELGRDYLIEEFKWIIEGRGLETLEEYKDASRAGRGIPFGKKLRETVWALHQAYLEEVHADGYETWGEMRNRALAAAENGESSRSYDYVVVDEAQDLTPSAMALMAEIAETPQGIFMASDHKQSIYSRNYAYTTVHPDLQFVGRTRILRRNYRSTEEIEQAAFPLLDFEQGEDDEMSECVHSGPVPVLVRAEPGEEESKWVAKFAREMARHLRFKLGSTGVLVPNSSIAEDMAEHLSRHGVSAEYFKGEDIELDSPEVKVITLHSSKGLEFPTVIVCGLYEGTYPHPDDYDEEEYEERMRVYRRLLYVAMTRAMRGLMVVAPTDTDNEAIEDRESEYWFEQGTE